MSLDSKVEYNFYAILIFMMIFYLCIYSYMCLKARANYLMDNIKHSYTESFDNYDLSELSN